MTVQTLEWVYQHFAPASEDNGIERTGEDSQIQEQEPGLSD
jgi:hypothetical protein